jgi:ABC-type antimicrobial peptide transport system permease subunit
MVRDSLQGAALTPSTLQLTGSRPIPSKPAGNTERIFAQLCSCFAALALLMSCVGLYGMLAYTVARRTGEIGIRMALGADRHRIIWMVLREMIWIGVTGSAFGLAAAGHVIQNLLYGIQVIDPTVILIL